MKFDPHDIEVDFMVKVNRFRARMCDTCADIYRGDKFDESSHYNKKGKIYVIPYHKKVMWKNHKCHNMDCKNKVTHGVYGLKMIMESV